MNDLMLSTPGVAIQELPFNVPTINGVATAIPAFIGPVDTANAPDGDPLIGRSWRINSLREFKALFGTPSPSDFEIYVEKRIDTEGALLGVDVSYQTPPERNPSGERLLYHALDLYFSNGGGPCYIRPIDDQGGGASQTEYEQALVALESIDEITLNVVLNTIGADAANYGALVTESLNSCRRMKDRFTLCDVQNAQPGGSVSNLNIGTPMNNAVTSEFRDNVMAVAEDILKYGAAYIPYLNTLMPVFYDRNNPTTVQIHSTSQLVTFDAEGNQSGTTDLLPDPTANLALSDAFFQGDPTNTTNIPGEKAIVEAVLALLDKTYVTMPPSPAMAGIYARVDRIQGVQVAPANVAVSNVTGPALTITDSEQGVLNVDLTSGKSVNAIRAFTGRGTLVWGSRTLAGNSGDWKFINRRRTALYLEESIGEALEAFVFQPNVPKTWVRVKRMIEGFLLNEWRAGTLSGPTAPDAFDVSIGLGSTMTQQDITDGIMRVLVRVVLPGPAEKIILQFTQKALVA
jgi:phage tail sheath protein FI